MIVINVGGFKTGSTWVYNIMRVLVKSGAAPVMKEPVPEQLASAVQPWDKAEQVWSAISALPEEDSLQKIHFYERSGCVLPEFVPAHVKFVGVVRDAKDTFVSNYYHELGLGRFEGDFAAYFDEKVDAFLKHRSTYERYWARVAEALPGQVHTVSYEQLKGDYVTEIESLIAFLGVEASAADVEHLYDIEANKKVGTKDWMNKFAEHGQSFYRKGVVGDHLEHFTEKQLRRFKWIEFRLRVIGFFKR